MFKGFGEILKNFLEDFEKLFERLSNIFKEILKK